VGQLRALVAEAAVDRLGAGHVVARRADAADAGHDARQLLDRPALDEALEAAQLGDLEVAVLDRPVVVEEDLDLAVALEPGDRVDADAAGHRAILLCSREAGRPKR
jgi:hypothetical protein